MEQKLKDRPVSKIVIDFDKTGFSIEELKEFIQKEEGFKPSTKNNFNNNNENFPTKYMAVIVKFQETQVGSNTFLKGDVRKQTRKKELCQKFGLL